jgi:hypothetical protein
MGKGCVGRSLKNRSIIVVARGGIVVSVWTMAAGLKILRNIASMMVISFF